MESVRLDVTGIREFERNRPPYLMIDMAEEVIPGKSARGYKHLAANEWFFPCHFPGDPSMPGMLQIEALMQLFALTVLTLPGNKGRVCYVTSADKLKFTRKVVPGDRLDLECVLHSWKRGVGVGSGVGSVNGQMACRAEFTIVMPDVLNQYNVMPENPSSTRPGCFCASPEGE